jgi:hypothetical protein
VFFRHDLPAKWHGMAVDFTMILEGQQELEFTKKSWAHKQRKLRGFYEEPYEIHMSHVLNVLHPGTK